MAIDLLNKKKSPKEVVSFLMDHYGVSSRQGYRYVREAQGLSKPLQIPEGKVVFTVKLPVSLIKQIRERGRRQGRPISDLVAEALEQWLSKGKSHG